MKHKYIPNPHFLLVSFFILIIIGSGSSLKAQNEKAANNSDTIINEKRLSKSKEDQAILLKKKEEDKHIDELRIISRSRDGIHTFKFNGDSAMLLRIPRDTSLNRFWFKVEVDSNLRKRFDTMRREMDFGSPNFRGRALPRISIDRNEFPGLRRNNSSTFNYTHTDKDGISTRMNISISDAEKDKLKRITGTETIENPLEVNDLTIFPNFSSGKLGLTFNLASRGTIRVRISDSDLKEVFADEAANLSGNYIKQIPLPKNGIYYISISQNARWFVRKMIKD